DELSLTTNVQSTLQTSPGRCRQRIAAEASLRRRVPLGLVLQILVNESDRHAALTDGRSNAFDRAQPHISTGEHTGDTRFEQVWIAAVRPAPGLHYVVTGKDIPSFIARDVCGQPSGLCVGTNENEQAA